MRKRKAKISNFRFYLIFGFISIVWVSLWSLSFYIQIVKGKDLKKRASSQHWKVQKVVGKRGDILSRDGEILAKSILVKSVFASPKIMTEREKEEAAYYLSRILGKSKRYILSKLKTNRSFVWIKRKLDEKSAYEIKKLGLAGIYLTEETKRVYPQGSMLGQLIGFVGIDNKGLEGLEYKFDDYLSGEKRTFLVLKDAFERILYAPDQLDEETKGKDLVLTIDTGIQAIVENGLRKSVEEFNARYGMALVVDVKTGEILAWAQYPFFNPNRYYVYSPKIWKNRIALDEFEPGSTIKPFLVAAAIEKGICNPNSIFFCEKGRWNLYGHIINDTHSYGWLSVKRIIRYSSNICSAKIALKLGKREYISFLKKLGFGKKTDVPVPAQADGYVRSYDDCNEFELATMGFGQGISVTLLQLTKAYLCLANKGVLKPLILVKRPVQPKKSPKRVFSVSTSQKVLRMLMDVVEADGTGRLARIKGIKIGGKTGTAQKATKRGYTNKYVASFVALLPALKPKYLIAVVIDEPKKAHYGGVVAAPVARYIAKELSVEDRGVRITLRSIKKSNESCKILKPKVRFPTKKGIVPKVVGLDVKRALALLLDHGVVPEVRGSGVCVVSQRVKRDKITILLGDKCYAGSHL